ncbi:MAG: TonB-dependent receptor [Algoriphagus sp.]|nr:TonB-dependent receptor [Algoriphagus sp.]
MDSKIEKGSALNRVSGMVLSQKKMLLLGLLFFQTICVSWAWQSSVVVTGKVSTPDGEALPGVVVLEKATNNGVVTDLDGGYSISVTSPESILVFSLIGFEPQEITVGNLSMINVNLAESESLLQEVVVVGYGEQKKLNMTGSVETLKFDEAVNQPVTNSAQLMYGKFSGVQLTQSSGLPGSDGSAITIRGIGTFGGTNPLVVIDNIQYEGLAEFNNLAPSDIESISVLKDASASAIYGARGANGVLVVTTKKGTKGKFSVDYNNYFGTQKVTEIPEYLDAVNYALLRNERDRNVNGPTSPIRFSEADIDAIRNGTNPDQYSNTKWSNIALQDAPIQNHYLSFSGGSEQTTYRISLGFLDQDAVVKGKFKSERYNLGINLSIKPNDWLTVTNVTNGYWSRFEGPSGGAGAITGETGIINQFQRSSPVVPVYYSNGELGVVDGAYQKVNFSYPINHVLLTGTFGDYNSDNINISERIGLSAKLAKGLFLETSGSAIINYANISNFRPTLTTRDWEGNVVQRNDLNTLTNTLDFSYRLMNENILRYSTSFQDAHNLSFIVGFSVIYDKNDGFSGSLSGFPTDAIQEFNGGGVVNPSVSGGASEEAWQSFFGRVNYNFKEKYLFEANVRRDGSSKFGENNRYGTFPSVSAGWNIAREDFLSGSETLTDLKLRASWGVSGNDRIGNYIYEQTYNTGLDYTLGQGVIVPAVALTSLANPFITWESIEQFDIGLDASFFSNKVSLTADYFKRISSDILYTNFPIPSSIGVTNLAAVNAAGMENSGVELSLGYRQNIGKLVMNLSANVTRMADNEVTDLGPGGIETIGASTIIRIGEPFNAYYGYQVLGVFQTLEEVTNSPKQFGSNLTAPGDLKYADLSGPEGIPDGVINASDRTVIGNPFPEWIYGMNAYFQFKGFDMNLVFQGVGNVDRLLNTNGQTPMEGDRNNALSYWINRWTPENPSETLPRLGGVNNGVISSFYIEDMSYLRLRNIELGYTLPSDISKMALLQKARIFISGQNLLTFTKVNNFDPERQRGGGTDQTTPLYKVISGGINIKF